MNAQHSASTGEWYTPKKWIRSVRESLGHIHLDPCSSDAANANVKARGFFGPDDDALNTSWNGHSRTGFVNPPGTCLKVDGVYTSCGNKGRCSCALPKQFLAKCMIEAFHGMDLIYLAYSVNQLRQISKLSPPAVVGISIALPPDRIAYLDPTTMEPMRGTNCDSAFLCLSKREDVHKIFRGVFTLEGCEVFRRV